MRFRTTETPTPYLNRQFQRRMLMYVLISAAVLVALQSMFPSVPKRTDLPQVPPGSPSPNSMDFRVDGDPNRVLGPDEFVAPIAGQPRNSRTGTVPVPRDLQDVSFPKDLFENVRDNTLGIRREEYTAYFALLDHVQQIPTSQLEQAAVKDVLYINLMTDSDRFRGEPMTIIGEVVRIYPFQASPNPYNLKQLYEAWIVTKDSETHPYRVVVPTLGPGLKPGENLGIAVKVTGCFFKREGYRTAAGLHVTPTLLARRINVYRSPNQPPPADGLVPIMASAVIGIGLILTATLLSFAWADRRAPQRRDYLPSMSNETADTLAALPLFSVDEMLENLAEQEREAEYSTLRHPAVASPPPPPRPTGADAIDLPTPTPPTRQFHPASLPPENPGEPVDK